MTSFPLFKWLARGLAVAFGLTLAWTVAELRAQDSPPSGVLAKIPPDASGFVYVKAGAIWKSEALASLREMVAKAGPDALTAFNKRFVPAPSTLDSLAIYVLPPGDDGPLAGGVLLGFSSPFDQAKALKSLVPHSESKNHFGQKYVEDTSIDLAIKAIDNKTLLLTGKSEMPRLLSHDAPASGPQSVHLKAAAGKAIYASADLSSLPPALAQMLPGPFQPLLSAKSAVFTCDVGKDLGLKISLKYADAAAAAAAEKAARDAVQAVRDQLAESIKAAEAKITDAKTSAGIGGLPDAIGQLVSLASAKTFDEYLANLPLKVEGDAMTWESRLDPNKPQMMGVSAAIALGVVMPATQKVRAASVAAQGQNNLRQLALAMHSYHDVHQNFPAAIFSKDGKKALLSWRVAMLPYVEQNDLYKQFKLDEPWDSEHNKKLLAKMPAMFIDTDAPPHKPEEGLTHYQVFVGGGAGFRLDPKGTRIFDITDGTSNTIMIATATNPVPWTKPADLPFAMSKPLPKLGFPGKKINVALFDGSVRSLPADLSTVTMKALITMAGGELIGDDF